MRGDGVLPKGWSDGWIWDIRVDTVRVLISLPNQTSLPPQPRTRFATEKRSRAEARLKQGNGWPQVKAAAGQWERATVVEHAKG